VQVAEETPSGTSEFISGEWWAAGRRFAPLTSPSITQLVALVPGVSGSRFAGPHSAAVLARQFSANGGRGINSEVILDGSPQTVSRI
jgi:hypothetical protein